MSTWFTVIWRVGGINDSAMSGFFFNFLHFFLTISPLPSREFLSPICHISNFLSLSIETFSLSFFSLSPIEIYQHMSLGSYLFALYHLCLSAAVSEWVIPAITSSEQFYSYIMARARYISMNYYSIIFPIPSQPVLVLLLITTCFAEKPQMPIL
jgi:hypothetical protein